MESTVIFKMLYEVFLWQTTCTCTYRQYHMHEVNNFSWCSTRHLIGARTLKGKLLTLSFMLTRKGLDRGKQSIVILSEMSHPLIWQHNTNTSYWR